MGEIAYIAHRYVSLKMSFAVLIGVPFVVFCLLVFYVFRFLPVYWQLYYVFCPVLFSFWIWDSDSFGRKEIFGMVLFVLLIVLGLSKKSISYCKSNPAVVYVCLNVSVFIAALVHEIIVFFVPFFVLVTNGICQINSKRKLLVYNFVTISLVPVIVLFIEFLAPKRDGARVLMENSWKEMFFLDKKIMTRALDYLYMGMSEGVKVSLEVAWTYPTNMYYSVLFIVMALPLFFIALSDRKAIKKFLASDYVVIAVSTLCVLVPLVLFVVGMDYGRWINQILTYWFFLFAYIYASSRQRLVAECERCNTVCVGNYYFIKTVRLLAMLVFVVIFGAFGVKHYVDAGDVPVIKFLKSPYYKFYHGVCESFECFVARHPSVQRLFLMQTR